MKRPLSISAWFSILAFAPISLALIVGFWVFDRGIETNVRQGLGQTLTEMQRSQTKLRLESRRQQQVFVSALAENATLKAGLSLWRESRSSAPARRTVEDLLIEIGSSLDSDLLAMFDAEGRAVTVLERQGRSLAPIPGQNLPAPGEGRLIRVRGRLFDTTTVPVNTEAENLGALVVGTRFEAGSYHGQTVLMSAGKVLSAAGIVPGAYIESVLAKCGNQSAECGLTLDGKSYLALAVESGLGEGYIVWTLHSLDQAASKLLGTARIALWGSLAGLLIAAFLADFFGARAVSFPLTRLIERLRESERSGVLKGDFPVDSSTREVNELARAFNLAARSVADSQRQLDEAYLQITQTMAQTLDARDPYTAGHSSRVSGYAVAIAEAMSLNAKDIDVIRTGANFHDIGKIGIPDAVLQKPGPLTDDEFGVIKRHPVIGKRILEGVARFCDYLSIVELHHENHDGTGYPWGLRGENVPLGARIVHVVDAFDAMTTSRPYRAAMPPDTAISILRRHAGSQFDPAVVEVFLRLVEADPALLPPTCLSDQLRALDRSLEARSESHVEDSVA
jgi:hypothetical protein